LYLQVSTKYKILKYIRGIIWITDQSEFSTPELEG